MFRLLKDIGRWVFWGPIRITLSHLNPDYIFRLENILSFFAFYIQKERNRFISNEVTKSFIGESSTDSNKNIVRACFKVYVSAKLRLFFLSRLNSSNIYEYVYVDGLENLKKELERKKGSIILNPHFGPFMLVMPALSYRGFKLNQIALQGDPPWRKRRGISKYVYDMKYKCIEGNLPAEFINAADGVFSLRKAFNALKNNEVILYPSTGRGGKAWHTVNFMGKKALFSITPFKIALKTKAPLLPVFVLCEDKKTKVIIEKPITIKADSTAERLLEKYVEILVAFVRKYPEHFLMYLFEVNRVSIRGRPSLNGELIL